MVKVKEPIIGGLRWEFGACGLEDLYRPGGIAGTQIPSRHPHCWSEHLLYVRRWLIHTQAFATLFLAPAILCLHMLLLASSGAEVDSRRTLCPRQCLFYSRLALLSYLQSTPWLPVSVDTVGLQDRRRRLFGLNNQHHRIRLHQVRSVHNTVNLVAIYPCKRTYSRT